MSEIDIAPVLGLILQRWGRRTNKKEENQKLMCNYKYGKNLTIILTSSQTLQGIEDNDFPWNFTLLSSI